MVDTAGMPHDREPAQPYTRIRATCPACGEVEMPASAVTLRRFGDAGRVSYDFVCPGCAALVTKPADERIAQLLTSGGVRTERDDLPAEALEPRDGPPLTYDDLLDLHLLLESPGWEARLTPPE
jgi:hypothetical protein